MKILPAIFLALFVTLAFADDVKLIPFTDAQTYFPSALGKQVDVRFSDGFAKTHLDKTDFDALILSELPDGKACFFGRDKGLDPDAAKLKDVGRSDQGDICVSVTEVSV